MDEEVRVNNQNPLSALSVRRNDDAAIAFSPALPPAQAEQLAQKIAQRLDDAGLPRDQRVWIVAADTSDDESRTAKLAAAIADACSGSLLNVHDPRDHDALIFQRRIPGQRRGGIYLNLQGQSASYRIACGDPLDLIGGLSAWFNRRNQLRAEDLAASLLIR